MQINNSAISFKKMSDNKVLLKRLSHQNEEDVCALQNVYESAPHYSMLTTGSTATPDAAISTFQALPQGKTLEDKFVFGIIYKEKIIGCVDLVRSFPNENTAMLGLLLLDEKFQQKGLGKQSFVEIENELRSWKIINKIRIAVIKNNTAAFIFWQSMGFQENGEKKAYVNAAIVSENIVMEKTIN